MIVKTVMVMDVIVEVIIVVMMGVKTVMVMEVIVETIMVVMMVVKIVGW